MTLTAEQTTNLNMSMEAARQIGLGSIIADLVGTTGSGLAFASGSARPNKQSFPVDTGLTTVTGVICSLSGSPTLTGVMWASAVAGSTAGDIIINSWKPTATGDVTPIASTGSAVDQFPWIYWLAIGT